MNSEPDTPGPMGEDGLRVRRTDDLAMVESLVPDHPHLTEPLAGAEDKHFILGKVDGEPAGTAWVRPLAARTGAFGGLYVGEEHRGVGLGGRLMDAGLGELAALGARVAMLGVHLDNEEGLGLARSRGFRTVSLVPGRATRLGSLVGGWVEAVSPLPFPDRSTRLMAVWLEDGRRELQPEPEAANPGRNGAAGKRSATVKSG